MNRVIVIGSPGAGKSVFSRRLSQKTGLPLVHLDTVWHKPDKTHISREEFDRFLLGCFQQERWILDGDYSRTLEARLEQADTVFFLDYPLEICMEGIRQRLGQPRADMPWVEDSPDRELVQIVQDYPNNRRVKILALMQRYQAGRNTVIFHTREEADRYLDRL